MLRLAVLLVPARPDSGAVAGPTRWPRYRYDQLMNIGWKRLIPIGMVMVLVNAAVGMLKG